MEKTKLSKEEVLNTLTPVIERRFGVDTPRPQDNFKNDYGAEPVEVLEFIDEIKTTFNVQIPDKTIEDIDNVNDLILEILGKVN